MHCQSVTTNSNAQYKEYKWLTDITVNELTEVRYMHPCGVIILLSLHTEAMSWERIFVHSDIYYRRENSREKKKRHALPVIMPQTGPDTAAQHRGNPGPKKKIFQLSHCFFVSLRLSLRHCFFCYLPIFLHPSHQSVQTQKQTQTPSLIHSLAHSLALLPIGSVTASSQSPMRIILLLLLLLLLMLPVLTVWVGG